MFPLMVSISLDFYLIARVVLEKRMLSLLLSLALLSVFSTLWFLLPRLKALERRLRGG
jgi:hypothetical protein